MAMRNVEVSLGHYQIRDITTFSEHDIIQLQDVFLTAGFHHITVSDITQGRSLITTFTNALNYYRAIASLTCGAPELEQSIFDIYKYLHGHTSLHHQRLFE